MGWIILLGPLVGGIVITLAQVLGYRALVLFRVMDEESVPHPPVIIIRSFIILIVAVTLIYFVLLKQNFIEPIDITTPPEGFGVPAATP